MFSFNQFIGDFYPTSDNARYTAKKERSSVQNEILCNVMKLNVDYTKFSTFDESLQIYTRTIY